MTDGLSLIVSESDIRQTLGQKHPFIYFMAVAVSSVAMIIVPEILYIPVSMFIFVLFDEMVLNLDKSFSEFWKLIKSPFEIPFVERKELGRVQITPNSRTDHKRIEVLQSLRTRHNELSEDMKTIFQSVSPGSQEAYDELVRDYMTFHGNGYQENQYDSKTQFLDNPHVYGNDEAARRFTQPFSFLTYAFFAHDYRSQLEDMEQKVSIFSEKYQINLDNFGDNANLIVPRRRAGARLVQENTPHHIVVGIDAAVVDPVELPGKVDAIRNSAFGRDIEIVVFTPGSMNLEPIQGARLVKYRDGHLDEVRDLVLGAVEAQQRLFLDAGLDIQSITDEIYHAVINYIQEHGVDNPLSSLPEIRRYTLQLLQVVMAYAENRDGEVIYHPDVPSALAVTPGNIVLTKSGPENQSDLGLKMQRVIDAQLEYDQTRIYVALTQAQMDLPGIADKLSVLKDMNAAIQMIDEGLTGDELLKAIPGLDLRWNTVVVLGEDDDGIEFAEGIKVLKIAPEAAYAIKAAKEYLHLNGADMLLENGFKFDEDGVLHYTGRLSDRLKKEINRVILQKKTAGSSA
jgi:hypothetical protein